MRLKGLPSETVPVLQQNCWTNVLSRLLQRSWPAEFEAAVTANPKWRLHKEPKKDSEKIKIDTLFWTEIEKKSCKTALSQVFPRVDAEIHKNSKHKGTSA